jgi:hypothetical protein
MVDNKQSIIETYENPDWLVTTHDDRLPEVYSVQPLQPLVRQREATRDLAGSGASVLLMDGQAR